MIDPQHKLPFPKQPMSSGQGLHGRPELLIYWRLLPFMELFVCFVFSERGFDGTLLRGIDLSLLH
jgi:hypothetical protein